MESQLPSSQDSVPTQAGSDEAARLKQEEAERRTREHVEMVMRAIRNTCIYCLEPQDFTNEEIYRAHSQLVIACANEILSHHGRKFVLDDNNRKVVKFLMLYFNNSPLALDVFPNEHYSLDKNIMLVGPVGTGKTLLMDIMKLYLSRLHSPLEYRVFSQTQMLNYFKQHNNIDFFTFNTADSKAFEGKPFHVCLNDIGLKTQKFYGNDTERIIEEFLFARYEIWEQQYKRTHITTNLETSDIAELFGDGHNRLFDRFKMFNVIPLLGESRR